MQPVTSLDTILRASRAILGLSLMHAGRILQEQWCGSPTTRTLFHGRPPARLGVQHGVMRSSVLSLHEQHTSAHATSSRPTATATPSLTQTVQPQLRAPKVQPHGSKDFPTIPANNSSSSNIARPPSLLSAAPVAPPISAHHVSQLADFISRHRSILVITGAGCSTESNIPDYRGPSGAYTTGFKPMTHQQFMAAPENRARCEVNECM